MGIMAMGVDEWNEAWETLFMKELQIEAVKTLHSGGVVAHATETCYGLAVDIFQKSALSKLYALKRMDFKKPVSILVRDLKEAKQYGDFPPRAEELAETHWPGPLTIIVPRKASLPRWLNFGTETIGFRVSSNKKTRELIEAFGGPLSTTSANISGQAQAYTVQDFMDQGLVPDFILDSGQLGKTPPSTVVQVLGGEVKVLRQGTIQIEG